MRFISTLIAAVVLLAGCDTYSDSMATATTTPFVSASETQEPLDIDDYLDLSVHEPIADGGWTLVWREAPRADGA